MAAVHRHRLPAAGTGKTTAITQLGKTHEATDRLCHPGLSRIPVIYVTAPPAATPPMLAVEFTRILGLPATHRANMTDVIEAVCGGAIDTISCNLAAETNTGLVRERNEDSEYVGHWLCAVADGLGGHVAGDSAAVVKALRLFDVNVSPGQLTGVLGRAVSAASEQLAAMIAADRNLIGIGPL